MEPLSEKELAQLLRRWEAPAAPSSLQLPIARPKRPRWQWLWNGSIRIPIPVGVAIVAVMAVVWIQSIRHDPQPTVRSLENATAPAVAPVYTAPPSAAPPIEVVNPPAVAKSAPAASALAGFRPVSQLEPRVVETR